MNYLRRCGLALALTSLICASALAAESLQSDSTVTTDNVFLLTVAFQKIDFIHLGELAHYTTLNQNISFSVFPTVLVNEETQQSLINGPDAFFAVTEAALVSNSLAKPFLYCLDMLREMALNPDSGAEMSLHMEVRRVTGVNFVVRRFNSCALHPA